jgi:hypothetical protein
MEGAIVESQRIVDQPPYDGTFSPALRVERKEKPT